MSDSATLETPNVVPFALSRRIPAPPPEVAAYGRDQAVERLRKCLPAASLVYVTRRWHHPDNDWLICDFFRIDGHFVTCITEDVALAIDRYDPEREVGVKLHRPRGSDPLTVLIDGTLSRVLHGEPGAVQHVVIN